ncbi:dimethylaniline monooxygenase [N-oxide-forming] 2-like [Saccoglossus kowalevskii]|uniref:Flavin-containing monooxygenase n=1 Tax=Saccoglossus kowalevskii TaxID=10224 RepID=A0ABM0GPQ3_SACKO|nr:PREDICTED: dimethylaniline monooxygenase [N-oxide-forming] 2-like [Saccoglossus kowalevskii]
MEDKKRILIIGAGVSGLTAIKSCLKEHLQPVCFERDDQLGGIWYYTEDLRPGQSSAAYKSIISNNSKETLCFSDFPFRKEDQALVTYDTITQYLVNYADHFGLGKYIHYNRNVVKVEMCKYYETTEQLDVSYVEGGSGVGDVTVETCDGIMVCSGGGLGKPYIPAIPGLDKFKGITIHGNAYRQPAPFIGKKIIVVYFCVRRPVMVMTRISLDGGWNPDMFLTQRLRQMLPAWFSNYKFNTIHSSATQKSPGTMVNDEILYRIACNLVNVVPEIARITETSVECINGKVIDDVDVIILAAGYEISYPIIDETLIFDKKEKKNIYRYILPVGLKHNILLIIGSLLNLYLTTWSALELQSRWSARLLSGRLNLPNMKTMINDVRIRPRVGRTYAPLPCTSYQDDLARDIGALPTFWNLLIPDPRLLYAYYLGPAIAAWYRLRGPAAWGGAKKTTLSTWDNNKYSLNQTTKVMKSLVLASSLCFVYLLINQEKARQFNNSLYSMLTITNK